MIADNELTHYFSHSTNRTGRTLQVRLLRPTWCARLTLDYPQ